MRALLLICVTLVFAIGLLMVYDTSSAAILDGVGQANLYQPLIRQLAYSIVGVFFAYVVYSIGYRTLLRISRPMVIFFSVLLLAVWIPGLGRSINGASRWVQLGGISLQPSELIKLFLVGYFIDAVLQTVPAGEKLSWRSFAKILAWIAAPLFLILLEPDHATVAVMGLTMLGLFAMMKIKLRYWALPVLLAIVIGGGVGMQVPYVQKRLAVYMDPTQDLRGKGHQPHQAKIAAGSGQLVGLGLGQSLQKMHYLPEAQNDYIAAIYAEETGWIGVAVLITLYMLIGYAGFTIAMGSKDQEGAYLAAALTFMICLHAFLNLGVVSGLLPSTGKNLPFISQGGSSLMVNLMAIGAILSVARQGEIAVNVGRRR